MITATIKLLEIAARSIFILVTLYSLPIKSSGALGLSLTLVGVFTFLCGFERYIDLQRNIIGKSAQEEDNLIYSVLRFFFVNYAIWALPLATLLYYWVGLHAETVVLFLVVAISEHLANEFYRISIITHKHRGVLYISMIKNILLLGLATSYLLIHTTHFSLNEILTGWSALSLLGVIISVIYIIETSTPLKILLLKKQLSILNQYKKSATHFKIGLVALLALQTDRIIAGSFLTMENSGVYFRHLFLAISVYQILGIISFNRVMPKVYAAFNQKEFSSAKSIIFRERLNYFFLSITMIACILIIKLLQTSGYAAIQNINTLYITILLAGYLIRGIADFNVMSLNALHNELYVFYSHTITLIASTILAIILTTVFGLLGLIVTTIISASIYMVVTQLYCLRISKLI